MQPFLLAPLLTLLMTSTPTFAAATCPTTPPPGSDEQPWDCPWAGIGRKLKDASGSPQVLQILKAELPEWVESFKLDQKLGGEIYPLWGESINFDENTQHEILPKAVPHALSTALGIPPPRTVGGRGILNAGVQHTYGYLFSTEKTPYGYKRERWAKGDVQKGLGLTTSFGLKTDAKPTSTLFQEVTFVLAKLALGDSKVAQAALPKLMASLPDDVKAFQPEQFERKRVIEIVKLGGRTVEIRTDLVKFKEPKDDQAPKLPTSHLLIYSVKDSRHGSEPKLITAFPVAPGFAASLTDPSSMGDQVEVKAKFNAFVERLSPGTSSGAGVVVKGKRYLEGAAPIAPALPTSTGAGGL